MSITYIECLAKNQKVVGVRLPYAAAKKSKASALLYIL